MRKKSNQNIGELHFGFRIFPFNRYFDSRSTSRPKICRKSTINDDRHKEIKHRLDKNKMPTSNLRSTSQLHGVSNPNNVCPCVEEPCAACENCAAASAPPTREHAGSHLSCMRTTVVGGHAQLLQITDQLGLSLICNWRVTDSGFSNSACQRWSSTS